MRRALCGGFAGRSSTASVAAAFVHSPPLPPPIRVSFFTYSSEAAVIGMAQTAVSGVEWPASKVRDTFINFFESKNHVDWKSSPVVPVNDPTLLFANAGSVHFIVFILLSVCLPRKCLKENCLLHFFSPVSELSFWVRGKDEILIPIKLIHVLLSFVLFIYCSFSLEGSTGFISFYIFILKYSLILYSHFHQDRKLDRAFAQNYVYFFIFLILCTRPKIHPKAVFFTANRTNLSHNSSTSSFLVRIMVCIIVL